MGETDRFDAGQEEKGHGEHAELDSRVEAEWPWKGVEQISQLEKFFSMRDS